MALSGKYGQLDIPKIAAEEPVFILRGQDTLAVSTIRIYRAFVESHNPALARDLDKEIKKFLEWPGVKKMPD